MKTDHPLLTIAIPTYNRANFLRELLACLQPQIAGQPAVELLISDNASPDETSAVVHEFINSGLELRYIRNQINIGPDPNFLQCYEQAAGRYVWIFGDDDLILDSGLSTVVKLLKQESPDYMFVAPYVFQNSITEIKPARRIVPTMVVTDPQKMVHLVNLHADLILISGAIVDKQRIASLGHPPFASLVGTNLVQLGWVFTALLNLRRGAFLQLGVLAARAGNSRGGFQAAKVFGQNYSRAVEAMLPNESRLTAKVINDHLKNWFPRNWMSFRESGEDPSDQNEILKKAFGGNLRFWICVYPLLHAPKRLAGIWAKLLRVPSRIQIESRRTLRVTSPAPNVLPPEILSQANSIELQDPSVVAVVVLYNPNRQLLERLIKSIFDQVDRINVVDNTSHPHDEILNLLKHYGSKISYIPLGENTGIASAQNVGIQKAITEGFSHAVLLDQDSHPHPAMLQELLAAERALLKSGVQVAAVGPKFIDEKNGTVSKAIRHSWMRVRKIPVDGPENIPVLADYLIASGSLVRLSSVAKIGTMRDYLFIDWVDIEWGLRALSLGYKCFIVPNAVMSHSIGDDSVRILDKDINLHNDTRNYYIVRNATYLLRVKTMGWKWRSVTILKIPAYVCFYSWHSSRRMQSVRLLMRAISDGVRGKLGRIV